MLVVYPKRQTMFRIINELVFDCKQPHSLNEEHPLRTLVGLEIQATLWESSPFYNGS